LADSIVLVDADSIVYRSAFAGQRKDGTTGWLVIEPLENILATAKHTIEKIRDRTGIDRLELYLSPSEGKTYRHELAKQRDYKGNRKRQPRPHYYHAVRQYLVDSHGAKVVTAREADDELSIRAHQLAKDGKSYGIATIDKDLDQIPGLHYDYAKGVVYDVSEEDAERWFWVQCLAGDYTDNIPGCWKIGSGKAEKIVDTLREADRSRIWNAVVAFYKASQDRKDCPYRDLPPEDVALETAQLVYLQRKPGELWFPPQAGGPKVIDGLKDSD
jgi:5'-3' exonuclease